MNLAAIEKRLALLPRNAGNILRRDIELQLEILDDSPAEILGVFRHARGDAQTSH